MLVRVAIGTAVELNLEQRVLPFRDVTLRAIHRRVLPLQRIRTGRVLFHRERRRLPSLDGVTGGALATARTLGELAVVRIGLVAIHALLEYQRLLEIAVGVALGAVDAGVLALERKLGLRVVEALVDGLQRNFLPAAGVVAGLTSLRESCRGADPCGNRSTG